MRRNLFSSLDLYAKWSIIHFLPVVCQLLTFQTFSQKPNGTNFGTFVCTNAIWMVRSIFFHLKIQHGCMLGPIFSSPCQRQSEFLPSSLVIRRLSSVNFSHFNLLLSQRKWNLVGGIYGRSSLKIAHFVPIH